MKRSVLIPLLVFFGFVAVAGILTVARIAPQSGYEAPPREFPDYEAMTPPPSPRADLYQAPSAPTRGMVLIDDAHRNDFLASELDSLASFILSRGFSLSYLETSAVQEDKLRQADAFVVIAPQSAYTTDEVATVKRFVDKGGKLLLLSDPSRQGEINSLAREFDIAFERDYLYNMEENVGNFRYISIEDLEDHPLTEGIESIALFVAGSVSGDGKGLALGDENTFSSLFHDRKGFSPIVLSENAQILAIHDLTFLRESYMTTLGNSRLISNIANWVTTSDRIFQLSDFPYFLQDDILIVPADPSLLHVGIGLGDFLAAAHKETEIEQYERATSPNQDTVFLGLFEHAVQVREYLQAGNIWVVVPGEIHGRVDDPTTGDPVPGAIVRAASGESTFETNTEGDGSYTLGMLPPATYALTVSVRGYPAASTTIELGEGVQAEQDFGLTPVRGDIGGAVRDGDTSDPMENAQVILKGTDYAATTSKTGYYTIKDVPGGMYDVTVSLQGYRSSVRKVDVGADETVRVSVALIPLIARQIGGRVTDAETGEPIQGATITAADEGTFKTSTGKGGEYTLNDLEAGTYELTVSVEGYDKESVTVKLGSSKGIEQDLALKPLKGGIEGTIRDADTGEPIEKAKVTLRETKHSATTDEKGHYEIEDVPGGTYNLIASAQGYVPSAKKVKVIADETARIAFDLVTPLVITAKDVGTIHQKDVFILYLHTSADRRLLICLADTEEKLQAALDLLESGEYRQWLVSDALVIHQDSVAE